MAETRMRLYCKSDYANPPYHLFFPAGVIEVDERVAEILFRDAPDNFMRDLPAPPETKALNAPPADKMLKEPKRKK